MRYIIYGAGGVGSVLGGFLHLAGCEVVLVGRKAHVDAIKKNGLKLISSRGRWNLSIPAVTEAAALLPFSENDCVLLTAKSQHTYICLSELKQAGAPEELPVICMQNSIWNEPHATRIFRSIYGTMIIVPGFYMNPGQAIHWFSGDAGYIDIGCYPAGTDSLCNQAAEDLTKAGFVTRSHPKVMKSKAGKCLGNLANAYAVIDSTEEEQLRFMKTVRDEAMMIWKTAGIEFETIEEFRERTRSAASFQRWEAPELQGMDWGGSGWQSLARRAGSSEAPQLNGDVVRIGRELGISAPANEALTEITVAAVKKGLGPKSVSFSELEERCREKMG